MSDATTAFFESLDQRGHEPMLEHATGTLRFDLTDNDHVDHWFIAVDEGDIAVSHRRRRADCTVRATKRVFADVARGKTNALAAVLRGAIIVEGEIDLLTRFERLFPAPAEKQ
jgi:putative sterol carrier protein